jgi:integrase
MTNSQNQVDLKQMCESARKAGFPILPHMSWHWLRRIFATRFIERFPDKMAVLIQLLGHSNPHTVHRYIRHSDAWMDEQIRTVMETSKAWPYIGN